jgi:hypothetical protein
MTTLQKLRSYEFMNNCEWLELAGSAFASSSLWQAFLTISSFLLVLETAHMVIMVKLHQLNNGGDPVPVERVVRSCGFKSGNDHDFLAALGQNQQTGMLEFCYYRNKRSLKVTPFGEAYVLAYSMQRCTGETSVT